MLYIVLMIWVSTQFGCKHFTALSFNTRNGNVIFSKSLLIYKLFWFIVTMLVVFFTCFVWDHFIREDSSVYEGKMLASFFSYPSYILPLEKRNFTSKISYLAFNQHRLFYVWLVVVGKFFLHAIFYILLIWGLLSCHLFVFLSIFVAFLRKYLGVSQ